MGKKEYNRYTVGKNYPKNTSSRTPICGAPNSNLDTYDRSTGMLVQRRKFGRDGYAERDLDRAHPSHRVKKDHAHDYPGRSRGPERPMSSQEKREFGKASRKRRFY